MAKLLGAGLVVGAMALPLTAFASQDGTGYTSVATAQFVHDSGRYGPNRYWDHTRRAWYHYPHYHSEYPRSYHWRHPHAQHWRNDRRDWHGDHRHDGRRNGHDRHDRDRHDRHDRGDHRDGDRRRG